MGIALGRTGTHASEIGSGYLQARRVEGTVFTDDDHSANTVFNNGPDYISPMVHHRINEREANPNKHVNFITALPAPEVPSPYGEEDARQLLRALAAQVRPIMKSHGFEVNSLEEVSGYRLVGGQGI